MFCAPCRVKRAREVSARFRAGINRAPGEVMMSSRYAACSLSDVAKRMQVTLSRVQQIERIALLKVRRALMPIVAEYDPAAAERLAARETEGQKWMARTAPTRELSLKQQAVISQLRELAKQYESDGQPEIAAEIRQEVADLQGRLERVLSKRSAAKAHA